MELEEAEELTLEEELEETELLLTELVAEEELALEGVLLMLLVELKLEDVLLALPPPARR